MISLSLRRETSRIHVWTAIGNLEDHQLSTVILPLAWLQRSLEDLTTSVGVWHRESMLSDLWRMSKISSLTWLTLLSLNQVCLKRSSSANAKLEKDTYLVRDPWVRTIFFFLRRAHSYSRVSSHLSVDWSAHWHVSQLIAKGAEERDLLAARVNVCL